MTHAPEPGGTTRPPEVLADLLRRVSDGIVVLDRDWNYLYVNNAAAAMFGRRPEDLVGRHIWTEFPEGVDQPFHLAYKRAIATQERTSIEEYYAPWDRWFENRIFPSPDGLTILFQEITERKRAQLAAEDAVERMNLLLRGTETGLWDWDLRTNKVRFSAEWKGQIGYAEDEISDDFEEWRSRVHPDDLGPALARVEAFLKAPGPGFENEFRFRHKDGSYRWIMARAHSVLDDRGTAIR